MTAPENSRISLLGWFFAIWSIVGGLVMAAGIDENFVLRVEMPEMIRTMALGILRVSDALWISLAAGLVFAHEARRQGAGATARSFAIIAVASGAAEWLGASTGWLFGDYDYSGQFGWRIGGVLPFTIPLAWFIVVTGACRVAEKLPWKGGWPRAIAAAALATLTDVNLEPVAMFVRGYWQWTDGPGGPLRDVPPFYNYACWFVLAFLLARAVPIGAGKTTDDSGRWRAPGPVAVLVWMNVLFFLAHLGRWFR
jgi:putative membrane protein